MPNFPIVDSHVHLLDTKRFGYGWTRRAPRLLRDRRVADLAAAAAPVEIERFVFVEADVDLPQHLDEARWVSELARHEPRLQGMVASLPLERGPAVESEMEMLAQHRIVRGVRRLIQNQPDPDYVLQRPFIEAVTLLPRYGFSFDICIFHHQMANTIRFVQKCPEVQFVLDHIGKPGIKAGLLDPWRKELRALAAMPNVHCKISGVATEADHANWTRDQLRPYIEHAIDCFGFERVMFGGDWPVVELAGSYPDWVAIVDGVTNGCTEAERRRLFRDNAVRFYRLDG